MTNKAATRRLCRLTLMQAVPEAAPEVEHMCLYMEQQFRLLAPKEDMTYMSAINAVRLNNAIILLPLAIAMISLTP